MKTPTVTTRCLSRICVVKLATTVMTITRTTIQTNQAVLTPLVTGEIAKETSVHGMIMGTIGVVTILDPCGNLMGR